MPRATAASLLPGFELVSRLGGGRYADVYRARSSRSDVVIKIGRAALDVDPSRTDAIHMANGYEFHTGSVGGFAPSPAEVLRAEARVLRQVSHPAMVRLEDEGEHLLDGVPRAFLVLEPIAGATLRSTGFGPGRVQQLAHLLTELSAELPFHGDLKPDNVLLDADDRLRIIDPSAGSWTAERALATRFYNPLLARSDVPALGLMLLESLLGRSPFAATFPPRPARRRHPSFDEYLASMRLLGLGEGADLLARIALPTEETAVATVAHRDLERVALATLGLAHADGILSVTGATSRLDDFVAQLAGLAGNRDHA